MGRNTKAAMLAGADAMVYAYEKQSAMLKDALADANAHAARLDLALRALIGTVKGSPHAFVREAVAKAEAVLEGKDHANS